MRKGVVAFTAVGLAVVGGLVAYDYIKHNKETVELGTDDDDDYEVEDEEVWGDTDEDDPWKTDALS